MNTETKISATVVLCTAIVCILSGYLYHRSCAFYEEMAKNGYEERQINISMPSQKLWLKVSTPTEKSEK